MIYISKSIGMENRGETMIGRMIVTEVAVDDRGRIVECKGKYIPSQYSIVPLSMIEAYNGDIEKMWISEFGIEYSGG